MIFRRRKHSRATTHEEDEHLARTFLTTPFGRPGVGLDVETCLRLWLKFRVELCTPEHRFSPETMCCKPGIRPWPFWCFDQRRIARAGLFSRTCKHTSGPRRLAVRTGARNDCDTLNSQPPAIPGVNHERHFNAAFRGGVLNPRTAGLCNSRRAAIDFAGPTRPRRTTVVGFGPATRLHRPG